MKGIKQGLNGSGGSVFFTTFHLMKKLLLLALLPFSLKAQTNISLLGQVNYADLSMHGTVKLSNLWGYADETGKEYAIVGCDNGVSIVDVTNPAAPVEVFYHAGMNSTWREVKTYNNYAYITTEATEGMTIIDLNPLPGTITAANVYNFTGPASDSWISAHSLFIDEATGVLFLHGTDRGNGGVILYDLNSSPTNPNELGEFDNWYVHDSYSRGDTLYSAHIYDGFFTITDVSNPSGITMMSGQQHTPKNFAHNCWLSANGKYLFTTDEVTASWITAYDVTDFSDIKEVDRIRRSETSGSIAHNTYWLNNYLVTSYYRDGVTIHDVTDPTNMIEVGHYDTSPMSGDGFNGAWGVYPYLPSGNLLVSDMEEGLFILGPTYVRACYLEGNITDAVSGLDINAAHAEILTTPNFDDSDLAGMYSTGTNAAGTYDVIFSKPGYVSDTITVTLSAGSTVTQDVALQPLPTTTLTGTVTTPGSTPVSGAQVHIFNGDYTYTTTTDASGNFTIAPFVLDPAEDNFEINVGAWGYHTYCQSNVTIDGTGGALNIELEEGYYDDFMLDFGWTVSSTATSGIWVREKPNPSFSGFTPSNPGADLNSDCSDKAYVTGNADDFTASADDVDDGATTLISPAFNVTGLTDPRININIWFSNSGGTGVPNDTLKIILNDGSAQYTIGRFHTGNTTLHSWLPQSFKISDYTAATTNLTIRIIATDYSPGHVFDAAVDVFEITEGGVGIDEKVISKNNLLIYPNPTSTNFTVSAVNTLQNVQLVDITGKILMDKQVNDLQVLLDVSEIKPGVYSIRTVDVNGKISSARIVKN